MKITLSASSQGGDGSSPIRLLMGTSRPHSSRVNGSAVVVLLMLLSIMMLLVIDNSRTTYWLQRQVKMVEKQQKKRLATMPPENSTMTANATNRVTAP